MEDCSGLGAARKSSSINNRILVCLEIIIHGFQKGRGRAGGRSVVGSRSVDQSISRLVGLSVTDLVPRISRISPPGSEVESNTHLS